MIKFFHNLYERYIIWRYVRAGLMWGEADGYVLIAGECVGYESRERKFHYWEEKYKKLGYMPLSEWQWEESGGYGVPFEHLLKKKINEN